MTSLVAYSNRLFGQVDFTDTDDTFDASQPLENMKRKQLPLFAQFEQACEFDVQAVEDESDSAPTGENFDADVFALLGHTLDDGMTVEFLDGTSSLGTVTVANYEGLPRYVILALDSTVNLDTVTVKVSGGDSGTDYRIGAVWASQSFRAGFGQADHAITTTSLSYAEFAAATGYSSERESYDLVSVRFPHLTKAEAIGPAWPNWNAISRLAGRHEPVIVIPDTDELAYSRYGLVEAFTPARINPSPKAKSWRGGLDLREMR